MIATYILSLGLGFGEMLNDFTYVASVILGGLVLFTCCFFVRWLVKGGFRSNGRRR